MVENSGTPHEVQMNIAVCEKDGYGKSTGITVLANEASLRNLYPSITVLKHAPQTGRRGQY
jgi:hypothetical protein